jgi:peptidoglycan-associated lipoprotein
MTKQGVALVVSMGLIFSSLTALAGSRAGMMMDRLEKNAALAPRFDPSEPTRVDEFAQDPNLKSIHFAFDRATILPAARRIAESDANWLKENVPYEIVIQGHADDRGTQEYNVALAKRRAMALRNELVAQGVEPGRIVLVSYGEARPECRPKMKSDACWAQNRRADILVRRVAAQQP